MKLIIDINEMEYDLFKECAKSENYSAITRIIANGTPITEGDLIMFNLLMTTIADKGLPFEEVLLLIDNAPKAPESEDK